MPKIDLSQIPVKKGSGYPGSYAAMVGRRETQRLGDAGGITQFGVNLVTLHPGDLASLRHYHMEQDEFLMVTAGTLTLVDDTGDTPMVTGDCAAFPAGEENGHHMVNKSDKPGSFLVIGTRTPTETAYYSDIDMMVTDGPDGMSFTRRDGSPVTEEGDI